MITVNICWFRATQHPLPLCLAVYLKFLLRETPSLFSVHLVWVGLTLPPVHKRGRQIKPLQSVNLIPLTLSLDWDEHDPCQAFTIGLFLGSSFREKRISFLPDLGHVRSAFFSSWLWFCHQMKPESEWSQLTRENGQEVEQDGMCWYLGFPGVSFPGLFTHQWPPFFLCHFQLWFWPSKTRVLKQILPTSWPRKDLGL
jgi:hypothetical protein